LEATCPNVRTDAIKPENVPQNVRTRSNNSKTPDLPGEIAKRPPVEPNASGNHADRSGVRTDVQSGGNERGTAENDSRNVRMRQTDAQTKNSPICTTRRTPDHPNGLGIHADASSRCTDSPGVGNDKNIAANAPQMIVRTKPRSEEPKACENRTDTSNARTDVRSVGNDAKPTKNEVEIIRTRQMDSKTQNSPHGREIATPEYIYRWKRVSVGDGDGDVYAPRNTPIDTTGQKFVFGRVEGGDKQMVVRVIDETAGNGDGRWNGGDGDVNGTTSSGNVHSTQVEAALLATDSQQTRSSQVSQRYDSPVSFWPPIQPADRPYGPPRRQRRRGKLKI